MTDASGEKLFGGQSRKTGSFFILVHDPYGQLFFGQMIPDRDRATFFRAKHQVDLFANPILSNKSHSGLCFTDSWRLLLLASKGRRNRSCAAHMARAQSRTILHAR